MVSNSLNLFKFAFEPETKSGSNAVETNILLRREFTGSICLF